MSKTGLIRIAHQQQSEMFYCEEGRQAGKQAYIISYNKNMASEQADTKDNG